MNNLFKGVRADEGRGVAGAFFALFGIPAAPTMLEMARDALFLARLHRCTAA